MARVISDILDADALKFNHLIERWERRTGKRGHDLSLYSDMRTQAVLAIKDLGLDPSDTISGELYFALQEKAKLDNDWLAERLYIKPSDSPEDLIKKVIKWVTKHAESTDVWVCKPTVAGAYLKKQSPKTVMKALGLRSVDSMLKRNNPIEILSLAYELESKDWVKKLHLQFKKSKTTDFDIKKIQFFVTPAERSKKLKKAGFPVSRVITPNNEMGGVLVVPPGYRFPLDVLATVVSVSESIYELRKHSSLYRTLSVRKDFGVQFYNVTSLGINQASAAISEIGWNSLHRRLVGNEYVMARLEQPHLTKDDLSLQTSIILLAKHDPRFNYWKNIEYSVYANGSHHPVSLNLVDVVTNASNRTEFRNGRLDYARMRLWEELWSRYLSSDKVIEDVIDSYLGA